MSHITNKAADQNNHCKHWPVSETYPLLLMIGWTWLSGCSSAVLAATHSSMSSSNGWWAFCSTAAHIGMNEPRGMIFVFAMPVNCSVRNVRLTINGLKLLIEFVELHQHEDSPLRRAMWKTSPPRPTETPDPRFRIGGIHSSGLKYNTIVIYIFRNTRLSVK